MNEVRWEQFESYIFVKNLSSLWAWAKEVEDLLSVNKKCNCNRATNSNMYVIQVCAMACASICNIVSVVFEFS